MKPHLPLYEIGTHQFIKPQSVVITDYQGLLQTSLYYWQVCSVVFSIFLFTEAKWNNDMLAI